MTGRAIDPWRRTSILIACGLVLLMPLGCGSTAGVRNVADSREPQAAPVAVGADGRATQSDDSIAVPDYAADNVALQQGFDEENNAYEREPAAEFLSNSVLRVGTGAIDDPKSDASAVGALDLSWATRVRDWPLHFQAGGGLAIRQGDRFDIHGHVGLLSRSRLQIDSGSLLRGYAFGIYTDALRTREDSDLFSVHGLAGMTPNGRDQIGIHTLVPINESTIRNGPYAGRKERFLMRAELIYGRELSERTGFELRGGYQFGEVGSPFGGTSLGWQVLRYASVIGSCESNLEGDWAVAFYAVIALGDEERPRVVTRYAEVGGRDSEPFLLPRFESVLIERR